MLIFVLISEKQCWEIPSQHQVTLVGKWSPLGFPCFSFSQQRFWETRGRFFCEIVVDWNLWSCSFYFGVQNFFPNPLGNRLSSRISLRDVAFSSSWIVLYDYVGFGSWLANVSLSFFTHLSHCWKDWYTQVYKPLKLFSFYSSCMPMHMYVQYKWCIFPCFYVHS